MGFASYFFLMLHAHSQRLGQTMLLNMWANSSNRSLFVRDSKEAYLVFTKMAHFDTDFAFNAVRSIFKPGCRFNSCNCSID